MSGEVQRIRVIREHEPSNIGLSVLDLPKSAIHPPMVVLTAASAGPILVWPQ